MSEINRADLEAAARAFFDEGALALDRRESLDRGSGRQDDDVTYQAELTRERLRELEDQLRANSFDGSVCRAAEDLVTQNGLTDAAGLQATVREFAARVERQQMRMLLHRLTTPWAEFQVDDALFKARTPPPISPDPVLARTSHALTVARAVYDYLERKRVAGVGSSQLDEVGRALGWLVEHLKQSTPLAEVQKEQLRAFRDQVQRLDSRHRGKGGIQFLARQTHEQEHWISSVTSIRHLRAVQGFFAWASLPEHDASPRCNPNIVDATGGSGHFPTNCD